MGRPVTGVCSVMAGPTRRLSLFIRFACVLQFLCTVGMLSTLSLSVASTENMKEVVVGLLSLTSCLLGFGGAHKLQRGMLQMYVITQMWGLMLTTQYLYLGSDQAKAEVEYCNQDVIINKFERAAEGRSYDCSAHQRTAIAKMTFAAIAIFVTWSTSLLGLLLSEKVQDLEKAKKDKVL